MKLYDNIIIYGILLSVTFLTIEVNCDWLFPDDGNRATDRPRGLRPNLEPRPQQQASPNEDEGNDDFQGDEPSGRPRRPSFPDDVPFRPPQNQPSPQRPPVDSSQIPPVPTPPAVDFNVASNDAINIVNPINFSPCNCPFSSQYNPVCGSDRRTYNNRMVLNCHRRCGTNVDFTRNGLC